MKTLATLASAALLFVFAGAQAAHANFDWATGGDSGVVAAMNFDWA